jgi:hypothetical protein
MCAAALRHLVVQQQLCPCEGDPLVEPFELAVFILCMLRALAELQVYTLLSNVVTYFVIVSVVSAGRFAYLFLHLFVFSSFMCLFIYICHSFILHFIYVFMYLLISIYLFLNFGYYSFEIFSCHPHCCIFLPSLSQQVRFFLSGQQRIFSEH